MNLLVKWFHLCSAAGEAGPLVLIVSVANMKENEYFVQRVIRLSSDTAPGSSGWLYMCSSRGGTPDMWQHWFLNIVIPTLALSAECHPFKVK